MEILLLILKRSRINQKNIISDITELQEEYEALDDETVFATGNM